MDHIVLTRCVFVKQMKMVFIFLLLFNYEFIKIKYSLTCKKLCQNIKIFRFQNCICMYIHSIEYKKFLILSDCIVIKLRIANNADTDFVECELSKSNLTYSHLLNIVCSEFDIIPAQISRLRKLPNTRLRNDKDIKRLQDFEEIEIVLNAPVTSKSLNTSNAYPSITSKDQTVLY